MLTTSPNCISAKATNNSMGNMIFDSGDGCVTEDGGIEWLSDHANVTEALYIGYYDDPHIDWSLSGFGCPANASNKFLAVWGQRHLQSDNTAIGMFCEPSYWRQTIEATIVADNGSVESIDPLGPKVPLTSNEFNATAFHYILGTGNSFGVKNGDIINMQGIEQWPRVQNLGLDWPINNLVGYAIGLTNLSMTAYLEPKVLSSSFEKAHQALFALAVNSIFVSNPEHGEPVTGIVLGFANATTIVRPLTIVVEISLVIVTLLALFLLIFSWRPSEQSSPRSGFAHRPRDIAFH